VVNDSQASLDALFAALADPTRRDILVRLADGESRVTKLAEPLPISLPTVSRHLRVLESAGLIARRKDGRVHRISTHSLERFGDLLEQTGAEATQRDRGTDDA
jgi:DNA-binding transcriptional ArsR family regulator